jgi:hypothetical protein
MSDKPSSATRTAAPAPLSQAERLELYRVSVEMADRISARRGIANSFFLTLNTALIASAAVVDRLHSSPKSDGFSSVVVAVAGLILVFSWWLLLRSYRDLNNAKFKVIHALEEGWDVKPFAEEWAYLKKDNLKFWQRRYAELGTLERLVPFAFGVLYVAVLWRAR